MDNLLILGCSYSDLIHHTIYGNKEDSYTLHLRNELEFSRLINLAVPGACPSTINRILLQYLNNPVHGMPDFVFIQWPNANRNEYFIDERDEKEDLIYYKHNEKLISFNWTDVNEPGISNSTWASTTRGINKSLINAHERLYVNKSQQMINLFKEVGIAEHYLDNLKIPYAYVESDYLNDTGLLASNHNNINETNNRFVFPAYNYAQHLCHKQFLIPGVGIQKKSPTYANDDYEDGHPGPISHRRFADVLIPKLKELLNE